LHPIGILAAVLDRGEADPAGSDTAHDLRAVLQPGNDRHNRVWSEIEFGLERTHISIARSAAGSATLRTGFATYRDSWTTGNGSQRTSTSPVYAPVTPDGGPAAPDCNEIDSHAATMTMIAVLRIDSINGDSPLAKQASMASAPIPAPCEG
jgi:hypothetical protein